MVKSTTRQRYKRGYPVAVLVGFEEKRAVVWQIFSRVVKHYYAVEVDSRNEKSLYDLHESVLNALRSLLKEGIRSIIVMAPAKTDYAKDFLNHSRKRHPWLFQEKSANKATFGELVGSAGQIHEVSSLVKTEEFRKLLCDVTSGDANRIIDALEKRLNKIDDGAVILYSLEEVEKLVNSQWTRRNLEPEYIMMTDRYLANTKEKDRIHRLLQISKNKNIKTRIVNSETRAGVRLSQLGGLVCFTKPAQ